MVKRMDPGAISSMYEKLERRYDLQVLHNLYHTMFQCKVCLESHKIWVLVHILFLIMAFMQPYVTINDLVFVSCVFYGFQPL